MLGADAYPLPVEAAVNSCSLIHSQTRLDPITDLSRSAKTKVKDCESMVRPSLIVG